MDTLRIDVSEMSKFTAELLGLPAILRERLVRGAANAVMTELRDRAIALAPELAGPEKTGQAPAGNLKASIYRMRIPEACFGPWEVWKVGVRMGAGKWNHKRNQGKDSNTSGAWYAAFEEYGHWTRTPSEVLLHRTGRRDDARKAYQSTLSVMAHWVPGTPFMRPALDSMKGTFGQYMQTYVDRNLGEAVRTARYMTVR